MMLDSGAKRADGVAKSPIFGVAVVFQDLGIANVCLHP